MSYLNLIVLQAGSIHISIDNTISRIKCQTLLMWSVHINERDNIQGSMLWMTWIKETRWSSHINWNVRKDCLYLTANCHIYKKMLLRDYYDLRTRVQKVSRMARDKRNSCFMKEQKWHADQFHLFWGQDPTKITFIN